MAEVKRLMNEDLHRVTQEDWDSYIRHAENLQEEDFAKEIRQDKIWDPTVINLQDSKTEDQESDEDSDVTGAGNRDDDTPLAVPLDLNKIARYVL
jgi:hypothetical protein